MRAVLGRGAIHTHQSRIMVSPQQLGTTHARTYAQLTPSPVRHIQEHQVPRTAARPRPRPTLQARNREPTRSAFALASPFAHQTHTLHSPFPENSNGHLPPFISDAEPSTRGHRHRRRPGRATQGWQRRGAARQRQAGGSGLVARVGRECDQVGRRCEFSPLLVPCRFGRDC